MEVGVHLNSLLVNSPPDRVVLGRALTGDSVSTEMHNWVPVNLMPGKPATD